MIWWQFLFLLLGRRERPWHWNSPTKMWEQRLYRSVATQSLFHMAHNIYLNNSRYLHLLLLHQRTSHRLESSQRSPKEWFILRLSPQIPKRGIHDSTSQDQDPQAHHLHYRQLRNLLDPLLHREQHSDLQQLHHRSLQERHSRGPDLSFAQLCAQPDILRILQCPLAEGFQRDRLS